VAGMLAAAPPALADPIGDASSKLATASYPLLQQIDWARSPALNKFLVNAADGWSPGKDVARAVDSTLKLGVAMDPKLVKAAVTAHEKAVADAAGIPGLVTPLEDHKAVTEAIARMLASAPEDMVKGVFDTYSKVGLKTINQDWFASVNAQDARAAYKAFLSLKDKVRDQQLESINFKAKAIAPNYNDKLGAAAKDLADASYPLLKKIDWERTPVLTKWLGSSAETWAPTKISDAVEATLQASAAMDPKLIVQAVAAHDAAVVHAIDKPGLVTPLADHEAVTEAIARMLASAPSDKVFDVFRTYAKVGLEDLNGDWFSTLNAAEAEAAYKSFLALSEVVKAAKA